jgi:hypothetical protein
VPVPSPVPPRPPDRRRLLALGAALAPAALLGLPAGLSGCGAPASPDLAQLDQFLASYVDALNQRDVSRLSALLGANHDEKQIGDRLVRFGGRALRNLQITRLREAPDLYVVVLSARSGSTGRPFEAREIASWRRERWTLTPYPAPVRLPALRPA